VGMGGGAWEWGGGDAWLRQVPWVTDAATHGGLGLGDGHVLHLHLGLEGGVQADVALHVRAQNHAHHHLPQPRLEKAQKGDLTPWKV